MGTAEVDMVWGDKADMGMAPVGKAADRAEEGKAPDEAGRQGISHSHHREGLVQIKGNGRHIIGKLL